MGQRRRQGREVARLEAEGARLQERTDAVFDQLLDGTIDRAYFDRRQAEWRGEQTRLLREIEVLQDVDADAPESALRLFELAASAHRLWSMQEDPAERRQLLGILYSNCRYAAGKVTPESRQPSEAIALAAERCRSARTSTRPKSAQRLEWRAIVDAVRTACYSPPI